MSELVILVDGLKMMLWSDILWLILQFRSLFYLEGRDQRTYSYRHCIIDTEMDRDVGGE